MGRTLASARADLQVLLHHGPEDYFEHNLLEKANIPNLTCIAYKTVPLSEGFSIAGWGSIPPLNSSGAEKAVTANNIVAVSHNAAYGYIDLWDSSHYGIKEVLA
ncbi:MAG: hypothetical protein WC527_04520 [Candidatus Margulisiibacteriota bacterium]